MWENKSIGKLQIITILFIKIYNFSLIILSLQFLAQDTAHISGASSRMFYANSPSALFSLQILRQSVTGGNNFARTGLLFPPCHDTIGIPY